MAVEVRGKSVTARHHICQYPNVHIFMSWCTVIRMFEGFFSEKIIVGPQDFEYPRFLLQLTFTHYILRSTFFWTPPTPPICLKMPKCAIFGLFWSFHFKDTPKVGVHREKSNIGNVYVAKKNLVASTYVRTISFHFRNISQLKFFSPSPAT